MPKNARANTPPKSSASKRAKSASTPSRQRRRNGGTSSATTSRAPSPSAVISSGRYRVTLERVSKGWAWEMTMNGDHIAHGARVGTKRDVIAHLSAAVDRLNNPQRLTSHAGITR